jgi:hypothetical protein
MLRLLELTDDNLLCLKPFEIDAENGGSTRKGNALKFSTFLRLTHHRRGILSKEEKVNNSPIRGARGKCPSGFN